MRQEKDLTREPVMRNNCKKMDGAAAAAVWSINAETVKAVDFGKGYSGLFYQSEGRSCIPIPEG